ncbi:hypothetical protein FACS1894132_11230 [Clostridia bacterium]|nr:hypothetical protein FACS1894132_11230 [Clostridia bacterium]
MTKQYNGIEKPYKVSIHTPREGNNSNAYLSLEKSNVCVKLDNEIALRVPLLNIEQIITIRYMGASPALIGECCKQNITLTFLNPNV